MSDHTRSFWQFLCAQQPIIFMLFVLATLGLLLNVVFFFLVDPESGTYVVVLLNFPGLLAFTLGSGYALYRCQRQL